MLRRHDTAVLVTPVASWLPSVDQADWIGVDAGYRIIRSHGHECLFALGDFDSAPLEADLPFPVIELPRAKDETDTQAALKRAAQMGYSSIFLAGAFGGRLDHTIANLRCLVWEFPQVTVLEEHQRISVLLPGRHSVPSSWKHISFFAFEPSLITLEGFDYPLERRLITPKDFYTCSNSISKKSQGTVLLEYGRVLCVESDLF